MFAWNKHFNYQILAVHQFICCDIHKMRIFFVCVRAMCTKHSSCRGNVGRIYKNISYYSFPRVCETLRYCFLCDLRQYLAYYEPNDLEYKSKLFTKPFLTNCYTFQRFLFVCCKLQTVWNISFELLGIGSTEAHSRFIVIYSFANHHITVSGNNFSPIYLCFSFIMSIICTGMESIFHATKQGTTKQHT